MYWRPRTGDAACVGEDSASRIDEPVVYELSSVPCKCPAAAFCVARVEAEEESRYGRLIIGACRVRHRSFSICTLHGAAGCLIVKRRQCCPICFPLALVVC